MLNNLALLWLCFGFLSPFYQSVIRVSYVVPAGGAGESDISRPEPSVHA